MAVIECQAHVPPPSGSVSATCGHVVRFAVWFQETAKGGRRIDKRVFACAGHLAFVCRLANQTSPESVARVYSVWDGT